MGDSKVMTKQELLQQLTHQLRRPDLDDLTFIKMASLYEKLGGFNTPSPKKVKASPLDRVLEIERKRRG